MDKFIVVLMARGIRTFIEIAVFQNIIRQPEFHLKALGKCTFRTDFKFTLRNFQTGRRHSSKGLKTKIMTI